MKKDGKYRFSLQFSADSEEQVRAGELLERLGNRKSAVVVAALNDYLDSNPNLQDAHCKIEVKLRAEIYDKLNKGQDILDSVKKSFKVYQFINVFECYVDTNTPISNSLPFTYSDIYKEKMEKLKNEADELLNKKGIEAINKLTCNITQLSQFKVRNNRIAQKFRYQGYEKYACAIESRTLELEKELCAKNKYEATFVELYKDIAMILDASAMGYSSCCTALEKMKGWERFFLNITDMPKTLLSEHEAKVKNAITILTKRLDDISFSFRDVLNKVSLIQSLPELMQYRDKLSATLELGLKEEDVSSVNETLNQIAAAKSIIEKMPENIDDLKNYQKTIHAEDFGRCNLTVTTELDMKLAGLVKQQTYWISRYILPIENSIDTMSAMDCSNWLDRTQELPVYLDASSLNRYKDLSSKVEAQLHKSRVQGVYILYDKLNAEEKAEFLKMISTHNSYND